MYIHLESIIGLALIVAILHYAFTGLGWLLEPKYDVVKQINADRVARGLPPQTNQEILDSINEHRVARGLPPLEQ